MFTSADAISQVPQTNQVDLNAVKTRQQGAWSSGDYAVVGTTLQIVGEELCEALDVRSGQKVLDVAAGNGNVSLAAARRWCDVIATDYVPALLERARERAAAERLEIDLPRGRRGSAAVPGWQLRCRRLDLRGDVHARPGPRRERAGPRVQARRQDRPRQLDAGRLHRPALQDHRQAHAAARRHEVAGAVGHSGADRRTVRAARGLHQVGTTEFRVPLSLAGSLAGGLQDVLRAGAQDVCRSRTRRPNRLSKATSERSSVSSTAQGTTRWSCPASISRSSSPGVDAQSRESATGKDLP